MPRNIDWERIEREFRAGQLSIAEIARDHGISRAAIHQRARKDGWKRNLAPQVREEIALRLVTPEITPVNAREAIDTAAARGVEVVRQHRALLSDTLGLIRGLLADQRSDERKIEAAVARDLSTALKSLIPLERQAFNLDEPTKLEVTGKDGAPLMGITDEERVLALEMLLAKNGAKIVVDG